ncbi:hypothetical protein [Sphingomonas mesophila]|uniref:hypothetical protein n=1 Tax=Sphingomonas mesophila TaxID=2303576 RepID=UPI000E5721AB|nr:hypothetical protein [Sphingomonas mesophila]
MLVSFALALAAAPAPRLLAARDGWAAFDRGARCEAVGRALLPHSLDKPAAVLAISFDRAGRRSGELSVRLRRPLRPGSSVMLVVGEQPFDLVARGVAAWSRGPAQEAAILGAIRRSGGARVVARDLAGRRMTERFLLAGAPTAIDAAAAACAR